MKSPLKLRYPLAFLLGILLYRQLAPSFWRISQGPNPIVITVSPDNPACDFNGVDTALRHAREGDAVVFIRDQEWIRFEIIALDDGDLGLAAVIFLDPEDIFPLEPPETLPQNNSPA